jgi:hypothetical protein
MSSSRRSSKSEATSTPSSGNNSKRTSLSNKSSSSGTPSKEEIINLGFTEDVNVAEEKAIDWIRNVMNEPKGTWVPRWGKKLTSGSEAGEGLANLGRVIGQDFVAETKSHVKDEKVDNANYRVDWDTTKGRHFNATINTKVNNRYVAYPFGILTTDLQPSTTTKKSFGEQSVIDKMLALTITALDNNKLMTPEIAQKILKTFENPADYVKEYFKESGAILRRLISETHKVILQSDKANENAYKFDPSKLSGLVSDYLYEIWSPTVSQQFQSILEGSPPNYEDRKVLQILLNECAYAASEDKFSGQVLNKFSELLKPYEDNHIKIFLNHLIESSNPENEASLQKLQGRIFDLRRSTSPTPPLDSKTDQPAKSTSSTASAMLSMMSSRNQATQALKQTLQTPRTTEPTMSLNSSPSSPQVSSTMSQATISNVSSDNKEDKNVDHTTHRMR